jgi:hypothetical protein
MLHVEDGKLNRERRGREGAPCGNGNYCKSGRESFVSPFSYQIDNVVKETVTKVESEEIVEGIIIIIKEGSGR